MDFTPLVDEQIRDGRRFLEQLSAEGVPVTAGAWVKESEGGPWFLYLVTPLVTRKVGTLTAYRRTGEVLRRMPQPFWVEPFEYKVVVPGEAVGKAIRDIAERRPGPVLLPYGSARLGRLSIDGAYVYPPVAAPVG